MNPTLEERVAKLERILARVVKAAEGHPMGKMILKLIDLDES